MISAEIQGGQAVVLKLNSFPDRVRDSLHRAMEKAMIDLRGYVASSKLSGQVLNVRTGTLRRSITQRVSDSASSVTGIVGTNVSYAAMHEYGFHGPVTVKDHLRRTKLGGQANIRAFTRNLDMPERSFLRSALADKRAAITDALTAAVKEATHG